MKPPKTLTPAPSASPPPTSPPPASPRHKMFQSPPNLFAATSQLRPWQVKAQQAGRTPLPEAASQALDKLATARKPRRHRATEGGPRTLWKQEELDLLYELKTAGATWEEIIEKFPNRSLVGVKQAWWKYLAKPQEEEQGEKPEE